MLAVVLIVRNQPTLLGQGTPLAKPTKIPQPASSVSVSIPAQMASPTPSSDLERPLEPPTLDQYRKEAEANPEQTPPSLIAFAGKIGKKMEAALDSKDPVPARSLFLELKSCVLDAKENERPVAVQALCLKNADRLSKSRPETEGLGAEYSDLLEKSPENVRRIITAIDRASE